MPYPDNPFEETFDSRLIIGLNEEKSSNATLKEEYEKTLRWLCSAPKITTYRVNLLKSNTDEVIEKIQEILDPNLGRIETHPLIANVVVIHHNFDQKNKLEKYDKEIVVDVQCAAAILRGAHIYAPGVLGMMSGTQSGDKVSIYVDTRSKCKKGLQKLYEDEGKIFIGNGIARMMRYELFGENITQRGVAVEVKETISGCPSTGDEFLPQGAALLQNLPSILCIHALDPQPHETILDMCAAPGNKTTHIAELMQNKGNLVAIDKTLKKTTQLKARCDDFGAKVLVFDADSTNIVYSDSCVIRCLQDGPPFPSDTFDRILLDAPCSVLGKRPQFANRISEKVVKSYVPLQRKLFKTAVELLKVNGTLVYSTCTITLAENEGMVAWALRTFPYLKLTKAKIQLGGSGWQGTALKEEERMLVQRFGPDQEVDSIGFFFACFTKTGQNT